MGVGLLLLTFVFGTEVNGQRLTLQLGPFSGQPSELLKVILVVFLAGYLSENRALLVEQDTRLGPLRLPPLPYLAPMVAMWAIALVIVVIQRDLGAALLFFGVFLAMLGGVSLLLMERLPQDLVTQTFFGATYGLAEVQLIWLLLALTVATTLGIVVRSDNWLRR